MRRSTTDLHTTLTAFLLLTSCSLAAVDASTPAYSATERLLDHLVFPDQSGRDIVLAGLLTTAEPDWQGQLALLLCSMIADKDHQAALYLMRRWGEIISKNKSVDAVILQDSYAQFLVKVGQLIIAMSADPRQSRIGVYRRQLTFWLTNRKLPQPYFKHLAQRVLDLLPSITL